MRNNVDNIFQNLIQDLRDKVKQQYKGKLLLKNKGGKTRKCIKVTFYQRQLNMRRRMVHVTITTYFRIWEIYEFNIKNEKANLLIEKQKYIKISKNVNIALAIETNNYNKNIFFQKKCKNIYSYTLPYTLF